MTINQFFEELIRNEVSRQLKERDNAAHQELKPNTCVGQNALAKCLHVSNVTVNRWHSEGKFEGCYTRIGKKIVYDVSKIEKLYQKS